MGRLRGPCFALGGRHCGWELTESAPGAGILSCRGRSGGPSCGLRGCHCGWESPFRVLLSPPGSASSGRSGGVWTTGKGTGTAWSRKPRTPFSGLPNLAVAERPRLWGQGLYRFSPLWKAQSPAVFPSSLVCAGSPRDRTLNSGRLAQPCFWLFVGQGTLDHLLGWETEGSTNCTLET